MANKKKTPAERKMFSRKSEWLTGPGIAVLEGLARDGLTQVQISERVGVTARTFRRWLHEEPQLKAAYQRGAVTADYEVEAALFKAARGFNYTEDRVGNDGEVHEVQLEQAPNVSALIFWLKNRRPDKWSDRQDINAKVEQSGSLTIKDNPYAELTTEELRRLAAKDVTPSD